MMEIANVSWMERYGASEIHTLRCKLLDRPGMLGSLITSIGETGAHVGNIDVVGLDSQYKIRDITIYCKDHQHLQHVLDTANAFEGAEVASTRDEVLEIHRRGTIRTVSRLPIRTITDLRMLYTPGVAAMCTRIQADPDEAWEITGICDRVAIVTNGTAVLGLGNTGALASLPVMEGKAAIFAEFADISAVPILVDSEDPQVVIETVERIADTFGAIQLEDIAAPACFEIEQELRSRLDIPVFHDDQHGTATVLLAALINAIAKTGRTPEKCSVLILGAGAAGYAIAQILNTYGLEDVLIYDSVGPIYRGRSERMNPYKQQLAETTNKRNLQCPLAEGFADVDIFVGVAQPNIVTPDMIRKMADSPLVFPLSNPVGEISVHEALEAGAGVAADGRSINNALAYPGLFRGALDARAKDITLDMQMAAARKLAELADEDDLLPNMLDRNVHCQVATAVAEAAG